MIIGFLALSSSTPISILIFIITNFPFPSVFPSVERQTIPSFLPFAHNQDLASWREFGGDVLERVDDAVDFMGEEGGFKVGGPERFALGGEGVEGGGFIGVAYRGEERRSELVFGGF